MTILQQNRAIGIDYQVLRVVPRYHSSWLHPWPPSNPQRGRVILVQHARQQYMMRGNVYSWAVPRLRQVVRYGHWFIPDSQQQKYLPATQSSKAVPREYLMEVCSRFCKTANPDSEAEIVHVPATPYHATMQPTRAVCSTTRVPPPPSFNTTLTKHNRGPVDLHVQRNGTELSK